MKSYVQQRRIASGAALAALALVVLGLALDLASPATAWSQGHREVDLFSTADSGGELTMDLGAGGPTIQVSETLCDGGECLYSAVNIGLVSPDTDLPESSLFALDVGTRVSLEVVAIDAAVSVKVGNQTVDAPGESIDLGIAQGIHVHPEWQVVAPEGQVGQFPLSVKLHQTAGTPYADSQVFDLILTNGGPPPVQTVGPIPAVARERPLARGDQVVFYYDARDGFTSFLNVANEGATDLFVQLVFYGPLLDQPFEMVQSIPARGTRTFDVAEIRGSGLPAQAGVAFATAIDDGGQSVTSGALAGNFTVANLATQSAWGGPGAARMGRQLGGPTPVLPPTGTVIDGTSVVLDQLSPERLDLSVYYDPNSLQPADQGGNQVIFVAFDDLVGPDYGAVARTATWTLEATRNTGAPISTASRSLSGVQVLDLATLVGSGVGGSAGRLGLTLETASAPNRLVFFQESLGTFATGYLLPTVPPLGEASGGVTRPTRGLNEPAGRGDQLVYYYDARDGFTTFLNVANEGETALDVKLQFYDAAIGTPFETTESIPAKGTRTIDIQEQTDAGLAKGPGVAIATAVDGAGAPFASRALAGNFTVANLATQSAWGSPAAARIAVQQTDSTWTTVAPGTTIDGTTVVFDQITPENLDLSVYYNPATLQPVEDGGNQLIFVSFDDTAKSALGIASAEAAWGLSGSRNDGQITTAGTFTTSGVQVSDLSSVAGVDLGGSAGRLRFSIRPPSASNRFIYFAESLGTFATGYALPAEP